MPKKKVKEEVQEPQVLEEGLPSESGMPVDGSEGNSDPPAAPPVDDGLGSDSTESSGEIIGMERVVSGDEGDGDPVMPDLPDIPYGEEGPAGPPPGEDLSVAEPAASMPGQSFETMEAHESGLSEDAFLPKKLVEVPKSAILGSTDTEPARPLTAKELERKAFFALDFHELDRGLSPEERKEWNMIYASFRGQSVMRGRIVGVDPYKMLRRDPVTGETHWQSVYCAVVVPFRVRVLIPEEEMWARPNERPDYVFRNIDHSMVDFVVIGLDRPGRSVVGSRRKALRNRRYFFANQPNLHSEGAKISCEMLAVGPRRCLVSCYGYDLDLTQRELSYTAIPDLRQVYSPGQSLECIVKEYDRRQAHLAISVKETVPNPFVDAEYRHPVGSHRAGVIAGKYAGGVFCNLGDGLTVLCNYAFQYTDADFNIWDKVMVSIIRYDYEKMQAFGKIIMRR